MTSHTSSMALAWIMLYLLLGMIPLAIAVLVSDMASAYLRGRRNGLSKKKSIGLAITGSEEDSGIL